jgi:hypothetical protein
MGEGSSIFWASARLLATSRRMRTPSPTTNFPGHRQSLMATQVTTLMRKVLFPWLRLRHMPCFPLFHIFLGFLVLAIAVDMISLSYLDAIYSYILSTKARVLGVKPKNLEALKHSLR